jgi:hypothetical protein
MAVDLELNAVKTLVKTGVQLFLGGTSADPL